MDRHRGGDRSGGERHRGPSRWSDGPPSNNRYSSHGGHSRGGSGGFDGGGRHHPYRSGAGPAGPNEYPSGGGGGGGGYNGGGRHHPYRGGGGGGPPDFPSGGAAGGFDGGGRHHSYHGGGDGPPDYPAGGGIGIGGPGFRQGQDGPGGFAAGLAGVGQRRGGGFSGRGSPDSTDMSKSAKLFIGSVPKTATEEDVRPLFEEHGSVIEVALIRDRRTGQQQGCCFVKYATSEEADRAIRALHNQFTLPGGHGPIQVRYADGERERLVEYKLFVGSLNKRATEKEVEEIFSPYGHVEDVYIMKDDMKQSRGCGFVKFSNRDMAAAAIDALNGKHTMRGCEQPLIVRFADPKRPRPGESRGGPAFGGPGYGSRSQPPLGPRSTPNLGDPTVERRLPNAPGGWNPASPRSHIPSSQIAVDSDVGPKSGATASSLPGPYGALSGPLNTSLPGLALMSSTTQQGFSPSLAQGSLGHKISPLQKPLLSPQHLPPLQIHPLQQQQMPYSQGQNLQVPMQQLGQLQVPQSGSLPSISQALPSQQLIGLGGQLSTSQPLLQSLSIQPPGMPGASQQQLAASGVPHQLLQQPVQQSPSRIMLQQQTQSLQSTFQSTQQAFSQLQQQLQQMQPTLTQQQIAQVTKQQSPWGGASQLPVSSSPASGPTTLPSSTVPTTPVSISTLTSEPMICNWTEHTSPEGYKYYYNSVTKESKWEKPEELTLFEQQQQQQKLQLQHRQQPQQQQKSVVPQLHSQSQSQISTQVPSAQHISQLQQVQAQMHIRQQAPAQVQASLAYQVPGAVGHQNTQELNFVHHQAAGATIDPVRVQQGLQAAQEWLWKNKPAGA